jgi:hypothetical protein
MTPMPPPPKPAPSPDDERRRDAAAEADRLGREHSNKRELRARAERLRPATDERRTGVPGVPGAPVVQPRRESRVPDAEAPGRDGRTPAAPRPAVDRSAERPDRDRNVDRGLERPERPEPRPAERPAADRSAPPPPRAERPPARPAAPVAPAPVEEPPTNIIDEVAIEAEELLREGGTLWHRWTIADKVSVGAALLVVLGALLPWLKRPHEEVVLGVGSGGILHVVLAVAVVGLLVRRDRALLDDRGLRPSASQQKRLARRTALYMLLLSLASTLSGIWYLLVYGLVRRFEVPTLEIGGGLYLALAGGLGLSYSGFAYFWQASKGRGP